MKKLVVLFVVSLLIFSFASMDCQKAKEKSKRKSWVTKTGQEPDAAMNSLDSLADEAYQYKIRPVSMGGGGGSYEGYSIPTKLSSGARIIRKSSDNMLLEKNGVQGIVDARGGIHYYVIILEKDGEPWISIGKARICYFEPDTTMIPLDFLGMDAMRYREWRNYGGASFDASYEGYSIPSALSSGAKIIRISADEIVFEKDGIEAVFDAEGQRKHQ
ncbi:MAG: hypothetical protein ABSF91_07735 [Bacteroidota bacterium]|jgi:hypothetical protein